MLINAYRKFPLPTMMPLLFTIRTLKHVLELNLILVNTNG
uniref:Uncharacterized protein n=1 Tax=Rhizophora mucronata TaxID=61149 RepID=A0A2P2PWT7_RHIMU